MPVFKLSDLRTKVYGRVDNNNSLYTLPEVDYVINEAIATVALFTGFYRVTASVPGNSVANQIVYATPSGILAPRVVRFAGRQLQRMKLSKLVRQRRGWATETNLTNGPTSSWAPIGNTMFVINPIDAVGGRQIEVTGMGAPPKLVNANDTMVLENEYLELITEYGAHRLPLKEGGKIFADGSMALNDFYKKMKERKQYEKLKLPKYWKLEPKADEEQPQ